MNPRPKVMVVEQPAPLQIFQDGSPLEGVHSTRETKTYPSIQILNYTGDAQVLVSCVTADQPYRPHPNELIGKHCSNGVCYVKDFSTCSDRPSILCFDDLRIRSSEVSDIVQRLEKRKSLRMNPFKVTESDDLNRGDIDTVRLCFQVFNRPPPESPDRIRALCAPIVSQQIRNHAELRIHVISDTCSPASGGKTIMIFCNKIARIGIQVRFFELDAEGNDIWVGWGKIQSVRDAGLAFTTPKYDLSKVDQPKNVYIELLRPSDNARSDRLLFQYLPDANNIAVIMSKKRQKVNDSNDLCEFLETNENNNFLNDVRLTKEK